MRDPVDGSTILQLLETPDPFANLPGSELVVAGLADLERGGL